MKAPGRLDDIDRHQLLDQGIIALAKRVGPDPYTFIIAATEMCAHYLSLSLSANTDELREFMTALAEVTASDTRDHEIYKAQHHRLTTARVRLLEILGPWCARHQPGYSPPSAPETP